MSPCNTNAVPGGGRGLEVVGGAWRWSVVTASAALTEDLSSTPSTHSAAHNCLNSGSRPSDAPFWLPQALYTCGAQTHMQTNTHTCKKLNTILLHGMVLWYLVGGCRGRHRTPGLAAGCGALAGVGLGAAIPHHDSSRCRRLAGGGQGQAGGALHFGGRLHGVAGPSSWEGESGGLGARASRTQKRGWVS